MVTVKAMAFLESPCPHPENTTALYFFIVSSAILKNRFLPLGSGHEPCCGFGYLQGVSTPVRNSEKKRLSKSQL